MDKVNEQLEKNRKAYEAVKEKLEAEEFGRVVLLHDGEICDIYNDIGDAYKIGKKIYGLGNFTIEKIGATPISLGFFTLSIPTS